MMLDFFSILEFLDVTFLKKTMIRRLRKLSSSSVIVNDWQPAAQISPITPIIPPVPVLIRMFLYYYFIIFYLEQLDLSERFFSCFVATVNKWQGAGTICYILPLRLTVLMATLTPLCSLALCWLQWLACRLQSSRETVGTWVFREVCSSAVDLLVVVCLWNKWFCPC